MKIQSLARPFTSVHVESGSKGTVAGDGESGEGFVTSVHVQGSAGTLASDGESG